MILPCNVRRMEKRMWCGRNWGNAGIVTINNGNYIIPKYCEDIGSYDSIIDDDDENNNYMTPQETKSNLVDIDGAKRTNGGYDEVELVNDEFVIQGE